MTNSKVFAEKGRVKLVGDERDIGVATLNRANVWFWCQEHDINLEYQGTLAGTDVWRVKDEQQRVVFALRWL